MLDELDAADRTKLVTLALQGSSGDFPGRAGWEDRLWSAKETYVTQGRALLDEMREDLDTAHQLRDEHVTADDPRFKDLSAKLKAVVQKGYQLDANLSAVVLEGRDLARHSQDR